MKQLMSMFGLLALVAVSLSAQITMSSTTFAAAVTADERIVTVASATGITNPNNGQVTTVLFSGRELMRVVGVSGTKIRVLRGQEGTPIQGHLSGATVWVGAPEAFSASAPVGTCTASLMEYSPRIVVSTGEVYDCPTTGASAGTWVRRGMPNPVRLTDRSFFVAPSACYTAVSGNGTGTNGYTTSGTSLTPVVQASTSNTGTNTHTYVCSIQVPSRLTTGRGIEITDVVFLYGVQTSNLGTQAATLASGTMNSSTVFSTITFPTPAASETASTVAPVRADSGTLTITPVVGSFNVATTTAGAFYSAKFVPAAPIAVTTDLRQVLFTVTLQCAATSATVTNSPGLLVHYNEVPL